MRIHAPDRLPTLEADGAALHACAVGDDVLDALKRIGAALPADRAGIRLHGQDGLAALLAPSAEIGAVAASALGRLFRSL